ERAEAGGGRRPDPGRAAEEHGVPEEERARGQARGVEQAAGRRARRGGPHPQRRRRLLPDEDERGQGDRGRGPGGGRRRAQGGRGPRQAGGRRLRQDAGGPAARAEAHPARARDERLHHGRQPDGELPARERTDEGRPGRGGEEVAPQGFAAVPAACSSFTSFRFPYRTTRASPFLSGSRPTFSAASVSPVVSKRIGTFATVSPSGVRVITLPGCRNSGTAIRRTSRLMPCLSGVFGWKTRA